MVRPAFLIAAGATTPSVREPEPQSGRGLPMRPAYRLRFAARRRLTFWLLRSRNEITRFAVTAKPRYRG